MSLFCLFCLFCLCTALSGAQIEGLYQAARDELDRLDKENGELKGMVTQGGGHMMGALPTSRQVQPDYHL